VLETFHPLIRRWFGARFRAPTAPQAQAWPLIASRRDVLVSAPTGSGKTLAAFLSALDGLLRDALAGPLPGATRVLYVSPLRALSNDVERNLAAPLAELRAAAAAEGLSPAPIRVQVRTGDTPGARRQAMARRPPHVLVTTPESLYLLLTAERGRALLGAVETVIVDEIHAVARDKRGAHLALSLERLEALARRRPQRIGLSATVEPVREIARFLVGAARVDRAGLPRCAVVEVGRRRPLDLGVEIPDEELSSVASGELWAATYDRIAALVRAHRSTIVFVNTRRLAERAAHALAERLGEGSVAAHHGSLARDRRLRTEERLKAGELRAVVATSSLELGIDVGAVELVIQLGSPGALGAGLQRIGRAGHVDGAIPRGRLFPMTRDELGECAALVRGLRRGRIEATRIPEAPLDVLAQQLVAEAACGPIHVENLYALVRRAWPYRDLPRDRFDAVVELLAEGIARGAGRTTALLHRDGVSGRVRGRRGARIAALTGAGTIPDNAQYAVVAEPEGAVVGQVDEDFAVESLAGDVFLLGTASWRIRRVEAGVLRVEDARGAPPTVPFWNGEAPGRSRELSEEVSDLREEVEARLGDREVAIRWLEAEAALPAPGARQLVDYLAAGRAALGAIPTRHTLVAERFFDEAGGMQLVVHAPLGARVNRAYGLALRKRFCRTFDFELQAAATDDGVLLSLGPQHSFPLDSIFALLSEATLDEVLRQAALQAPMFGARWRWAATRALAIPRVVGGRRFPPPLARMRAQDLLAAVFPAQVACQDNAPPGPIEIPDHPLVEEALRDCLTEAMDAAGLRELLGRIRRGEVRLAAVDTPEPSPMAHELLNARPWAYLDDAPLEERRARAVAIRRALPPAEAAAFGALDPGAIAEVAAQVWPDVRDADELHDALLDLGIAPAAEVEAAGWGVFLRQLAGASRAVVARGRWSAAERADLARAADDGEHGAVAAVVRGWIGRLGPVTAAGLAERLGLAAGTVERALLALEAEGLVLRGRFLPDAPWSREAPHWCERTVLARIHRLTLGRLRREIDPVSTADLLRFLSRWQHVAPGTRLHGARGLAEVIGQLQGFHGAAAAWERDLLPARVAGYEPALLDGLCLSGEVTWGRISIRAESPEPDERRRTSPTRAAPVALVLREDLPWLLALRQAQGARVPGEQEPLRPSLSRGAHDLAAALARQGASFVSDLVAAARRPAAEVEAGLWELVSAGLATCDGFAGLRALLSTGRGRRGFAAGGGRWSLLRPGRSAAEGQGADALAPEVLERLAQQYLRRYGVVFRDLLAREEAPPWRELLRVYRTLEARGTIRGGRFVAGRSGEQFALPEAVDALRAVRRAARDGAERVEVSAADPLNLVGILTPGPRFPAGSMGRVVYVDGVPAARPDQPGREPASAGSGTEVAPLAASSGVARRIAAPTTPEASEPTRIPGFASSRRPGEPG
jgi:ATP-dependent Lhr-like helicase